MHAASLRIPIVLSVVMGASCGGRVVIDTGATSAGGAGGHGGAKMVNGGNTTSGVAGSPVDGGPADAADESICAPHATPPDVAMTACFPSTWCPPASSASAHDQLSAALGMCNTSEDACCGDTIIDQIPCEPSHTGGQCCYTVFTRINDCSAGGGSSGGGGGPPGCLLNGQICGSPADCCSQQCNVDYLCGPIQCRPEGYLCTWDDDCCNLQCVALPPVGSFCYHCVKKGQPCSDAGVPCCGTICDATGHC
jgi:hypothetical protein